MTDKIRNIIFIAASVAFMALISVLFFYPDDVDGRTLAQSDMQQGMANGQETQVYKAKTGETPRWTNSLFGGMPTFQISPSYEANSLMDWVAKVYGLGLPAPANLLFAMMIGFFIMGLCMQMRWYVALFGAVAWAFSTYFIIIIGAGHIWKFNALTFIPPTIGGIWLCYRGKYLPGTALAALFGSLQLLANHPQMSYYFGFVIVAIMGAAFMHLRRQHKTRQWLKATGCVAGAGLLALAANCASLYNTWQYSKETVRNKATLLKENPAEAQAEEDEEDEFKSPEDKKFDYITQWSYSGDETFTLLVPNVKGGATLKPTAGVNEPLSVMDLAGASKMPLEDYEAAYAGQFTQYFGDQPMTNGPVYVGAFVLALAVLALCICRGPLRWWLLGVTVLSILLAWGHNLEWFSRLFVDYFPGYSKFRTVSSILVIAEFTIPLLAMMALSRIVEICKEAEGLPALQMNVAPKKPTPSPLNGPAQHGPREALLRKLYIVCGALGLICLVLWLNPSLFGSGLSASEMEQLGDAGMLDDPDVQPILKTVKELRMGLVSADAIRSFLFLAFGFLVVWAYIKRLYTKAYLMVGGVLLVCLVDLYAVNKRYVNHENFTTATEITFEPTAADEQILKDKEPNFRVFDMDNPGGARSSYFHKTLGGYHAAQLTRYKDLWERQILQGNAGVINMLNTKYYMGTVDDGQGGTMLIAEENPDALGNAWWVGAVDYVDGDDAEMNALDSLDTRTRAVANKAFAKTLGKASTPAPGDYVKLAAYTPDCLTYEAKSAYGGVAVFSEIYFPWGWKATIDGKDADIARVNYALRGLHIPAGKHKVVFTFDPQSLHVTNAIGVTAVIMVYLLLAGAAALSLYKLYKRYKGVENGRQGGNTGGEL